MGSRRQMGQISAELMITVSSMMVLLLVMYLVNDMLRFTWAGQREILEASTASNQVALAINRAVAGGDGTVISFNNKVSASISKITISPPRAVRAETNRSTVSINGTNQSMASSTPIITNNTNISGSIPMNREIVVRNIGGVITVSEG